MHIQWQQHVLAHENMPGPQEGPAAATGRRGPSSPMTSRDSRQSALSMSTTSSGPTLFRTSMSWLQAARMLGNSAFMLAVEKADAVAFLCPSMHTSTLDGLQTSVLCLICKDPCTSCCVAGPLLLSCLHHLQLWRTALLAPLQARQWSRLSARTAAAEQGPLGYSAAPQRW